MQNSSEWYENVQNEESYAITDEIIDIDHIRDHVAGIVHAFYTTGDIYAIERGLDEVCHSLDMKMIAGDQPAVERSHALKEHLEGQREMINFLNGVRA